jgi:osmotically-inducible protein OsmY
MNTLNQKPIVRTIKLALPALLLTAGIATHSMAGQTGSEGDWEGSARDAWIDGKIETSYMLNGYLNPFKIDTHVENGTVVLTGEVDSQIDKDLAAEIAQGTQGVTKVHNELTVKPGARKADTKDRDFNDFVTDATLTAKVKFALIENDSTDGLSIDVDTKESTVTLHGDVESAQVRELAGRIASNVEGVARVDNQLKIAGQS